MKKKRYRRLDAKPGQLRIKYATDGEGGGPDIVYAWGEGCSKNDGGYLHHMLGCERQRYDFFDRKYVVEPSVFDELKSRGYDITTLTFSIQKKSID